LTPDWYKEQRKATEERKKKIAFNNWIQKFHEDDGQDDIIFKEDEEIHENYRLEDIPEDTLARNTQQ